MQNGKKPTREQKKLLTKNKLDGREWFYIKESGSCLVFRNRNNGTEIKLEKQM